MRENSVFLRYSRHIVQGSQRMQKPAFFWGFCTIFRKKWEKTVFFHVFRDTLYELVPKKCKNSVIWAFCMMFRKRCEKTVFIHVFRDTLSSSQKMWKTPFLSVLHDVHRKVWENSVFSRFSRHRVKFAKF